MQRLEEYVVTFEGDEMNVMFDPARRVGDLIAHALAAFAVDEQPQRCRLAGFAKVYHASQRLEEVRVPTATPLELRLPL